MTLREFKRVLYKAKYPIRYDIKHLKEDGTQVIYIKSSGFKFSGKLQTTNDFMGILRLLNIQFRG